MFDLIRFPWIRRCSWLGIFLATALHSASAPAPSLDRLSPLALRPGQTTELTVRGDDLSSSSWLWTSFPAGITRVLDAEDATPRELRFQITLSPETQPGVGALRLVSRQGVSEAALILIDELTSLRQDGNNHARDRAQLLTPPVAVDGRVGDLRMDYYRLEVTAGQQLSVDVVAARIGSHLDPLLRVLDGRGREVAYLDDDPGIRPDLRLRHSFESAGTYWLELRDVTYRGGGDSFYRLRLGDFPIVTVTYPMSAPPGEITPVQPLGRAVERVAPGTVRLPADGRGGYWAARFSPDGTGSYVPVASAPRRSVMETEPNDSIEESPTLSWPVTLAGRLNRDGDRDYYRIQCRENDRVEFVSRTRALGSPCDLWLQMEASEGRTLVESKIPDREDTSLVFRAPADGLYALRVEELNRQGGPDFAYEIDVRRSEPGFHLSLEKDRESAAPGASLTLKVEAARRDYDGPITLSVWGGGQKLAAESALLGDTKTETTMRLTVPDRWEPGRLVPLRVEGEADIGGKTVTRIATVRPALEKQFPNTRFFPSGLEDRLALGVTEAR